MRAFVVLGIGLFLQGARGLQCKKDSDCRIAMRSGPHSLFCVEGECVQLKSPGSKCKAPTECASYSFFGPLSCSGRCPGGFCCLFVPSGAPCSQNRPDGINGCSAGFVCRTGESGPVCTPSFGRKWVLGPTLSILGNLFINLGINLQKKSYTQGILSVKTLQVSMFAVGVGIYVIGKALGFSSYVFGNQSLMASLGAVGLIANSVFAPLVNEEVFTFWDLCAILFVLSGSLIIVTNSGGGSKTHSLPVLIRMYFSLRTVLWFSLLISAICVLFILCTVVEQNSEWKIGTEPPILCLDQKFTRNSSMLKYYMLFAYVGLSAVIASFTTLFAKSFGEMLSMSLAGKNQFLNFGPYFFLGMIILCTFGQIFWLNKALKRYDALLVVPVFHVLWTVTSVTTAGVYFRDFATFSASQFRYFILGLGTIFTGSAFLGFRMLGKETPATEVEHLDVETKQQ